LCSRRAQDRSWCTCARGDLQPHGCHRLQFHTQQSMATCCNATCNRTDSNAGRIRSSCNMTPRRRRTAALRSWCRCSPDDSRTPAFRHLRCRKCTWRQPRRTRQEQATRRHARTHPGRPPSPVRRAPLPPQDAHAHTHAHKCNTHTLLKKVADKEIFRKIKSVRKGKNVFETDVESKEMAVFYNNLILC